MGTYHSFVSEPLRTKEDADILLKDIADIIEQGQYSNEINNFSILPLRGLFVVVGIYKNLGSAPIELIMLKTDYKWATVSDENDFFNSVS